MRNKWIGVLAASTLAALPLSAQTPPAPVPYEAPPPGPSSYSTAAGRRRLSYWARRRLPHLIKHRQRRRPSRGPRISTSALAWLDRGSVPPSYSPRQARRPRRW